MRIRFVVFFVLGGAIIAAAFFAEAVGLANDPGWGRGRIALLVFGILTLAFGLFYTLHSGIVLSTSHKIQSFVSQKIIALFGFIRRDWYIFPVLILVILVYVRFASSGSWTHWEPTTRYCADLANSFKQGTSIC